MAKIVFVQFKAEQSTASVSSFTTTAMTVDPGDTIISCMCASTNTTLTASDSQVDSYRSAITTSQATSSSSIGIAMNAKGGSTTFTVTPGVATFVSISAQEYKNVNADIAATNSATGTSVTADPGNITPANDDFIYVSTWAHNGTVNDAFTFNVSGEGWQQRANLTNTTNEPLGSQDYIGNQTKNGRATIANSVTWTACVASFPKAKNIVYTTLGFPPNRQERLVRV